MQIVIYFAEGIILCIFSPAYRNMKKSLGIHFYEKKTKVKPNFQIMFTKRKKKVLKKYIYILGTLKKKTP